MAKIEIKVGTQTYVGKTHKAANAAALDHLAALFPDNREAGIWSPAIIVAGENVGVVLK